MKVNCLAPSAGTHVLKVYRNNGYGHASIASSVAPIGVTLVIHEILPNSGSLAGGTILKISGDGFSRNQKENLVSYYLETSPPWAQVTSLCKSALELRFTSRTVSTHR